MTDRLCAILRGEILDLPVGDDGRSLLALAREHRVHLLLARQLRTASRAAPVPEDLVIEMRVAAARDVLRTRELGRVAAALDARGCAPVVFKGAALAHSHYPEPWLRPRLDADLLIAPTMQTEAAEVMRGLGYARPALIAGSLVMHQSMFVRPDETGGEHVFDVHWRLVNPNVVDRVASHEEIRSRAVLVVTGGGPIHVPSAADALVIACVHRAAHHADADDLVWLYDIHLLAGGLSADGWRAFADAAARGRVAALCVRGIDLAAERFGTAVDREARGMLHAEARQGGEPSAMFLRKDLRLVDRLRADVKHLGPAAGARLVREHLFPPFEYMREAYGVTDRRWLPAGYARRIFGGAAKWFRRPA